MMQDKNNLDDMAKKYKEEMMRLYSRKSRQTAPAAPPKQTVQTRAAAAESSAVRHMPVQNAEMSEKAAPKPVQTVSETVRNSADTADRQNRHNEQRERSTHISEERLRDLSHPPMPEIPKNYPDAGVRKNNSQTSASSNLPEAEKNPTAGKFPSVEKFPSAEKFPPAEEIMRNENASRPAQTVQTADSAREIRSVPSMEHNQGNYNAAAQPVPQDGDMSDISENLRIDESYPNENTDFSAVDTGEEFSNENPPDMSGQGYLQIEVTTASGAIPVRDATVIISESSNGEEHLIGMIITDENGTTPIVPLPAPPQSLSEAPDPSEKPYSEYNISVYKKGFYSIPKLTVPIFDTIKSIQPVSVIPLAEFDRNGSEIPNEKR